jgi:uncharacterized protein (TIGR03067 family)
VRLRVLLALVGLVGMTAFAPAPFPKRRPEPPALDEKGFQGTWKLVRKYQCHGAQKQLRPPNVGGTAYIRINGNTWTSMTQKVAGGSDWRIAVDFSKQPCTIDWLSAAGQVSYSGLARRKGDTVEVMYYSGTRRPASFDNTPPNTELLILQREP